MPAKVCFSSVISTRFEFGVPLEDIFPPQDIHPRLKYVFGKAFELYLNHGSNIEHILSYDQGTLNQRLTLKEKMVLALDYRRESELFSAGTYFWLIRHFLGLLPLPLLPVWSEEVHFDWVSLGDECGIALKHGSSKERWLLDYDIASTLNMLPIGNFILLNVIVQFIRQIALKESGGMYKFNRASLMALVNYYYSSLFIRPFTPGYYEKSVYRVLFFYLIIRWKSITKHCHTSKHNGNWFFKPQVITVYKTIPYLVNKYLKDVACQTQIDLCDREPDGLKTSTKNDLEAYKLAYVEVDEEESEPPEVFFTNNSTLYQTAAEFTFSSVLEEENKRNWRNIVQDTMETIKRVEGSYIYDDYETFKKEEFNQIGIKQSGSFFSKLSRYKLSSLLSPKMPPSSTPKKISPQSDNSYLKYPSVFDSSSDCSSMETHENLRDSDEIKVADHQIKIEEPGVSVAQKLFQNNSPRSEMDEDSKLELQADSKPKKRERIVKRIRVSLAFLRSLTPKRSTFRTIESRIRYSRIRNSKYHTA